MTQFEIHTIESAPSGSADALKALEQGLGFVPNLAGAMAGSPVLVSGFVGLRRTLSTSELTGVEREIVAIAVSLENDCDYCMAAHSTFAAMHKADPAALSAAREGNRPADRRLGVLYCFARAIASKRGHVGDEEVQALLDAGYSRGAVLEVVGQVALTTMANFTHNLGDVPLDEAFQAQAWERVVA